MKKLIVLLYAVLSIMLCSCINSGSDRTDFVIEDSNNITIWENENGEKVIVLAYEIKNTNNYQLYFKPSDFDIIDQKGNVIDTMESVEAYPAVANGGKNSVYYGSKVCDKIFNVNVKLKVIPHIDVEKTKTNNSVYITGMEGGGSSKAYVFVENNSSKKEYNNIHIAVISRDMNGKVVSVMTKIIDSIKPQEQLRITVEDSVKVREVGPDVAVEYEMLDYILPE